MKQTRDDHIESGAVLVFVCLVLFALIVMLGLAIDTSRWYIESSQQKSTSDAAALAALDAYMSAPDGSSHTVRFNAALLRAAAIGGANFSTARNGKKFIENATTINGTDSTITSGKWWLEKPAPNCELGSACPCGSTPPNVVPCFQECGAGGCTPAYNGDSILATAIRIGIKTDNNSRVANMFGGVFGSPEQNVDSRSGSGGGDTVASLAPRYGMLAIDVSRHTTVESDLPYERVYGALPDTTHYDAASEWAYYLVDNSFPGCQPIMSTNDGPRCIAPVYGPAPYSNRSAEAYNDASFPHTLGNYWVQTVPIAQAALIDTSRDPQPFATLLDAAHGALKAFKAKANHLDRLGLIPYNNAAYLSGPTTFSPVKSVDPKIDTMLKLTQTQTEGPVTAAQARAFRITNGFIPKSSDLGTNIINSVQIAGYMLTSLPRFDSAINSVTLFTQGMSSCKVNNNTCKPSSPDINQGAACETDYGFRDLPSSDGIVHDFDVQSMADFANLCGTAFKDKFPIKINIALAGRNVKPHSVLIKKEDGSGCMDDNEMRRRNFLNVIPDNGAANLSNFSNVGTSSTNFANYVEPNYFLYATARMTQGAWMPIRPACTIATKTYIDGKCALGVTPPTDLVNPDQTGSYVVIDSSLFAPKEQDAMGRLLCEPDPLASTALLQGEKMFGDAFSKRDLMLVE